MSERIASYTFLPWLRQGIASQIDEDDTGGGASGVLERASIDLSLDINGHTIPKTVAVIGPGDIVGINPRAIVRTEPRRWISDFEPNYLAFVEFYDEDFPWRYTPARATSDHRLRPWMFVVVAGADEVSRPPGQPGPLPAIHLEADPATLFPPADEAWAWAHVHVSIDVTNDRTNTPAQTVAALGDLVAANPDHALSRLVCPRRLEPGTPYTAYVVPAFETGRRAGLGLDPSGTDAQAASWGSGQRDFPVYHEWEFGTSDRGDFEYLAGLLQARPVDDRVGIRDMDVQDPGFGVRGMSDPPVMGLEGALRKPGAAPRPASWPPPATPDMLTDLEQLVNLQDDLLEPAAPGTTHPDPVISPPLYGRWHAMVGRLDVEGSGWTQELNRDPRLRVPAGFGAEVVAANQESLMARAWAQLGDVVSANGRIRQAQLAIAASQRIHARYLAALDPHEVVAATSLVHGRVRVGPADGAVTLRASAAASRLTRASVAPAFRRITRPRGRVARRLLPDAGRRPTDVLAQLDDGTVTAAPPKEAPEGQIEVDDLTDRVLPGWLPPWAEALAWFTVIALIVLALVLAFLSPVAAVLTAALVAAALALLRWLRPRLAVSAALRESNLTVDAVRAVRPRPDFVVVGADGDGATPVPGGDGGDSVQAARFRQAATELHTRFELELPQTPPRSPLGVGSAGHQVGAALDPLVTIPARLRTCIRFPDPRPGPRPTETVVPVMAHPVFADPMYAPLRDISSEMMIPNLELIPENTISLLETNTDLIEAYMVGLNHEMGRELLWREFPTDQRGSYFRQFWDVAGVVNRDPTKTAAQVEEEKRDITPLHTWPRSTALGTHQNRPLPTGSEPGGERLVLVVKGQLLKKYPTAVIFAQRARWAVDPATGRSIRELDDSDPASNLREPLFSGSIEPDVRFIGFALTAAEAPGSPDPADGDPGWFFVIQERPGEPRFGLDLPDDDTPAVPTKWDDLAWSHVTLGPGRQLHLTPAPTTAITQAPDSLTSWGANAADMAYVLYQVPAMVAVHADDMLDEEGG